MLAAGPCKRPKLMLTALMVAVAALLQPPKMLTCWCCYCCWRFEASPPATSAAVSAVLVQPHLVLLLAPGKPCMCAVPHTAWAATTAAPGPLRTQLLLLTLLLMLCQVHAQDSSLEMTHHLLLRLTLPAQAAAEPQAVCTG